jgi:hypothetical protein
MRKLFFTACLALAGCGSTGVLQLEDNRYIVSVKAPKIGFVPAAKELAACYKQANDYCANTGRVAKTLKDESKGSGFGRPASATLEFSCVERAKP